MKKPNIFRDGTGSAINYILDRIKAVGDEVIVVTSKTGLVHAYDLVIVGGTRLDKIMRTREFVGIYNHKVSREMIATDFGEWFIARG